MIFIAYTCQESHKCDFLKKLHNDFDMPDSWKYVLLNVKDGTRVKGCKVSIPFDRPFEDHPVLPQGD